MEVREVTRGLVGKVALVTGGSSGIGRASAVAFAREGARVVVADVDESGGNETVSRIGAAGGEAIFVTTDVSQATAVERLIATAVATYGKLDCAHNNAGIEGSMLPIADCSEADWDRTMAVNLKGVWLCMKYEIVQMLAQGSGAIVNTASVAGLRGFRALGDYVASKHAVVGLTRAAALDYAQAGLRINAVCPGTIRTPMVDRAIGGDPEVELAWLASEPMGRMGTPGEVAEAVVWLCSAAASFVTGHAMLVDGGFFAR